MHVVSSVTSILYAVAAGLYTLFLLHLLFPDAYHRMLAWVTDWYERLRGVGDWYAWRVEWERKMADGEAE